MIQNFPAYIIVVYYHVLFIMRFSLYHKTAVLYNVINVVDNPKIPLFMRILGFLRLLLKILNHSYPDFLF